jgi:hypothetical protein
VGSQEEEEEECCSTKKNMWVSLGFSGYGNYLNQYDLHKPQVD